MQFITVTKRRVDQFPAAMWTPELIEAESERVRTLYAEGKVRSIWRRKDMPGAVILLEAASKEEALATLDTLPLMQRNMLEVITMTELEPYPGFGPRSA
jgi:muconolactone delta-isomerase